VKGDPDFGERMKALRQARGEKSIGRPRIAAKYAGQVGATERTFARALPDEAQRYVDELAPKEPEVCPTHGQIICCPEEGCRYESQRTHYDHRAASYIFDRIMGKPTTRSENVITVQLVTQLTHAFLLAFGDVNAIADPGARSTAFAEKLAQLGAQYGGSTA
jgi:hypothetical protein